MKVRVGVATVALLAALLGPPLVAPAPAGAQQEGSISGTVTAEGGAALNGICVTAYDFEAVATADTKPDGTYTLSGLAPGEHFVGFNTWEEGRDTEYAEEWWREKVSVADADSVTVNTDQSVTGINGTLPVAAHITGTVTDEDSGDALRDICVVAVDVEQFAFVLVFTEANGSYDVPVRAGTYVLFIADCSEPTLHIAEWYDDAQDPEQATPVSAVSGETVSGIDAALAVGGAITGTVVQSHTGEPLPGVCVEAISPATGEAVFLAVTDDISQEPGRYWLGGLLPGEYGVDFNVDCHPGFEGETHPQQVSVAVGEVTTGIDAVLRPTPDLDGACPEGVVPSPAFDDTSGNPHAFAIDCVAWWEVARGTGVRQYSPTRSVRRDQMASFIARLLHVSGVNLPQNPPNAFTDDEGNPHELAINQLAAIGVVGGTGGGRYSPAAAVRRDQMATFLVNAYEEATGLTLRSAADGPVDHFTDDQGTPHESNINKAAEAAFTTGATATTYNPRGVVRRDQMGSFLARVLTRLAWDGFL